MAEPQLRFTGTRGSVSTEKPMPSSAIGGGLTTARELASRLKAKRSKDGWIALCPAHEDKKPSLSISEGENGKLLTNCFAGCSREQVWSALQLESGGRRETAAYDYRDENKTLQYQSVRFEPKDFRQRRPDSAGGWEWKLNGVRRVLYRLPELLAADHSRTVLIVEGEKDCDRLAEIGLVATTNAGGAGKWRDEYNQSLRGRRIAILPDNDGPGRKHAEQVARSLHGIAESVKVVELPALPDKGDVSDWLALGNGVKELRELVDATAAFEAKGEQSALVCSARELMTREFPEPKWAVKNLIPEGVTIFAAPPKVGKTWAGLGIAVAVASGGRALGAILVEIGDALYLGLEDGPKRLQDRLRLMLGNDAIPDKLFLAFKWPRFDEGGLDAIDGWLKEHPQARLIVIDTLKRIRPIEHLKERIYNADYDAIGPLGDLARKHGVAVVVIHHTRKMFSPDPLDLVSGSLGLTGAADGVLVLKRSRGEADATLHATGRDFEDQEIALRWDKEVMNWRMLGAAAEYKLSNERREVIALLRTSAPLTPKNASDLLGKEYRSTKKLLWSMARDGEVHADSRGRYSLNGLREPTKDELQRAALDPDEWRRLEDEAERQGAIS